MQINCSSPAPDANRPIRTDGPRVIKTDAGLIVRPDRPRFYPPYAAVKAQEAQPKPAG